VCGNPTVRGPRNTGLSKSKPICVDLDGTLVRTDTFTESLLPILFSIRGLANLRRSLTPSRPAFKQRVANLLGLVPDFLPYNWELVEYLREEKRDGRSIVLATAADERVARTIADYLGLFDQVIASDGIRNLEGEAKASELVRRFGRKGFDYVGNDRADFAVWREADGIIIVNASRTVSREARMLGNFVAEIGNRPPLLPAVLLAMRPHQWV
jgi:phosphoserine phosphatase